MKYLKYFEQASDYEAYKNGSDYVLPNVSYVVEGDKVEYNPENKIVYPVHFIINIHESTNTSIPQFFEAMLPIARAHYNNENVHPSGDTLFDTSEYVTWQMGSDDPFTYSAIYSYFYEKYDEPIRFNDESFIDSDDRVNKVTFDAVEYCSFSCQRSGNDVYYRYKSADGQYYYSFWSD